MAKSPYSHGIEVEQYPADTNTGTRCYSSDVMTGGMPGSVVRNSNNDSWHRDGSGPQEADYGPAKNVKTLLNRFYRDCNGQTWDWHNSGPNGGCGSHVHLHLTDRFDDELEAWTVSYNTIVEMAPFFAPFFCADWNNGFRSSVNRWASPQLTRLSQDSIQSRVETPTHVSRSYDSVTWNGASGAGKPLTIELRMNEAHPAVAVVGLLFLRRFTARQVEDGWSPKLQNHRRTLRDVYNAIYSSGDLFDNMARTGEIVFQEDRGINGQTHFDNALEVLNTILNTMGTDSGNYKDRIKTCVKEQITIPNDELWTVDTDSAFWLSVDER